MLVGQILFLEISMPTEDIRYQTLRSILTMHVRRQIVVPLAKVMQAYLELLLHYAAVAEQRWVFQIWAGRYLAGQLPVVLTAHVYLPVRYLRMGWDTHHEYAKQT